MLRPPDERTPSDPGKGVTPSGRYVTYREAKDDVFGQLDRVLVEKLRAEARHALTDHIATDLDRRGAPWDADGTHTETLLMNYLVFGNRTLQPWLGELPAAPPAFLSQPAGE